MTVKDVIFIFTRGETAKCCATQIDSHFEKNLGVYLFSEADI